MSKLSSTFLSGRQPNECRPDVDQVTFYSGATNDVPVIEGGNIVFKGGVTSQPTPSGVLAASNGEGPFRIEYSKLQGQQARFRQATPALKMRIRLTLADPQGCSAPQQEYMLELAPINTCRKPYEYDYDIPASVYRRCSTTENPCQIVEAFVAEFNRIYGGYLAKATSVQTVVNGVTIYQVDIEALDAGIPFRVMTNQGFRTPQQIVPFYEPSFTRSLARDWFGSAVGRPTIFSSDDANLNGVELHYLEYNNGNFLGSATSNLSQYNYTPQPILRSHVVIFEDNTNGNAALAALKSILRGPGGGNTAAPYLAKIIDDTTRDVVVYPYTIERTDNGSQAAYDQIKTDYSAARFYHRIAYQGGKSYYEMYTAANTPPAPVNGNGSNGTTNGTADTVKLGTSLIPYPSITSNCPAGTPCVDCPK